VFKFVCRGADLIYDHGVARKYEQQITLPVDPKHVWDQAHVILGSVFNARPGVGPSGELRASTSMSGMSWGEDITIAVSPAPGGCSVYVASELNFKFQLVDWGVNRKNVEKIIAGLTGPLHRG